MKSTGGYVTISSVGRSSRTALALRPVHDRSAESQGATDTKESAPEETWAVNGQETRGIVFART